jgi:radical SAM superfamily enzyme YgiQ (UPF0313 family)
VIERKKRIVLYYPMQMDPRRGVPVAMDLLPLSVLSVAAWPDRDGYEVVVIDANLYEQEEAHRRTVEACEGALLFATTGILGYQVADGYWCAQRVKATHPSLPAVIGGWFASVMPELQLSTGLYAAVCLGQGETTLRDVVQALDCGEPLDSVPGLALMREGQMVKTAHRSIVGWDQLPDCPWHLLDIEPYREAQLSQGPGRTAERMAVPPGFANKPFFGISYFSSFGCPEPCTFCCSPELTGMRWKSMPADRMLDDLCDLKERWGFDTVRFYDANWGVNEGRTREFCEGLIERDVHFWWYCLMQSGSIVKYDPATVDAMRDSGMYVVLLGGETGDEDMLRAVGKHTPVGANFAAAVELTKRDICSMVTYIIGYPNETAEAMMKTLDEARQIAAACPLSRAMVWPYRPIPGTALYEPSLKLGWKPPRTLEEWGMDDEYHLRSAWPGQIPAEVQRARKLYEHFSTVSLGVARGRIGWWEKRAKRRITSGDYRFGNLEAKAFDLVVRLARHAEHDDSEDFERIRVGYQTSVASGRSGPMG